MSIPATSSRGVSGARVKPNRAPSAGPTPWTDRLLTLPPEVLTCCFARLLSQSVEANEVLRPSCKGTITRFHAKDPPNLALEGYLSRLIVYMPCPRDAILLTMLYIDRISRLRPAPPYQDVPSVPLLPLPSSVLTEPTRCPEPGNDSEESSEVEEDKESLTHPLINAFTIHRLVLATLLVACKSECDGHLSQRRVAKVGGVAMRELIRLEVDVLALLDWRLTYALDAVENLSRTLWGLAKKEGLVAVDADGPLPVSSSLAQTLLRPLLNNQLVWNFKRYPSSPSSSGSVSPCMLPLPCNSSMSLSPPSSNESSTRTSFEDPRQSQATDKSSASLQSQRLASRASTETVRQIDRLSVS
ncbi:BQ2448_280 [Microbotryum intermedium]|uniref:BQ2448_280 protein n=1 Tax=Microbotryum intermedium TaxID=269621 RepID=A0A238F5X4_9BASI|nr:BQ2448_280 [Microbotryum intermedium]